MRLSIFWFRRDLRLEDNVALQQSLHEGLKVQPLFIFDSEILDELPKNDARVSFIYETLQNINDELRTYKSSLLCLKGKPLDIWKDLISKYDLKSVYINKDYEPYAIQRDEEIEELLKENGIELKSYKDQVIFEENEVLKKDGTPYTIYTPYKNSWLKSFNRENHLPKNQHSFGNLYESDFKLPELEEIGFEKSEIKVKDYDLSILSDYDRKRDFPNEASTSLLGPHLRFGTVGIRQIISKLSKSDEVFLSELIWREFYMQILYHFPKVVDNNFKSKYDGIEWRNDEHEFELWCQGKTGYPMVDAGMREHNRTGYMHNRVRMITASFLCKHLLIDWRWGESYFAKKLLDYELASNNGNWQWAAGTGCDAAPYFRVFNPTTQLQKFDKNLEYVKKWIPEYGTSDYPEPIVDHKFARTRALDVYKIGMGN